MKKSANGRRETFRMTSLTRRELLIGGSAILAAGALSGAALAAEAAEHSGFSMDTNIKGERSMTTITTKRGQPRFSDRQGTVPDSLFPGVNAHAGIWVEQPR